MLACEVHTNANEPADGSVRPEVQPLTPLDIPSDAAETTLGKRYIKEEFGAAANPQTTWQIDPFGHSATQSSLMTAASGYQGALQRLVAGPGGCYWRCATY